MTQPAGWYPQPDGSQRYWDGQAWTPHVTPAVPQAQPTQAPAFAAAPAAVQAGKPKKPIYQRVWFWLVIVVVVLPIIVSLAGGGGAKSAGPVVGASVPAVGQSTAATDGQSPSAGDTSASPAPENTIAQIGDTIRVGDLAVTVESAERKTRLSSVFGTKKGHWMLVTVKVANKGKSQVMVNDSDFTLLESDGTSYSTDSDGMEYIDSNQWLFLKKINPKTSATGKILFSIPKSAKHLTLEASGGLFGLETGQVSLGNK